ncbi:MAG: iron-containing alcohol dehydrogenase [Deltaproteobacteria bacterium]
MKFPGLGFEQFFIWLIRTKVMYSPGLRSEIGFEMAQLGGTKVALFTDKGLVDAGVADMVIEAIKKSDLKIAGVFDGILQDAQLDIINEGAKFYRQCGADCVIALGGGSVMDTVKSVNILIGSGEDDFAPLAAQGGLWDGAKPLPPHIAFPTTAGTACEVTNGIVVLDTKAHAKLSVTHPYCNSDIAMLDPELTVKLPAKITAFTGMDALTHAIEGVTSKLASPVSDALGFHAIRMVDKYLKTAVTKPDDIEARGNMLIASTVAGMCFINALTGAVHALAHSLGGLYSIPHGLANSIMLPEVMEFNLPEKPERFMMIADALGVPVDGLNPEEAGEKAIEAVRKLRKDIGLTQTLSDFKVPKDREALQPLIDQAIADGQMGSNPREMNEDDIYEIFLKAM